MNKFKLYLVILSYLLSLSILLVFIFLFLYGHKFDVYNLPISTTQAYKYSFSNLSNTVMEEHIKNIESMNSDELEKQILQKSKTNIERGRYLITAVANYGNFEFVLNLVTNLKSLSYNHFLIACLDLKLYKILVQYNLSSHAALVPKTWLSFSVSENSADFNIRHYCLNQKYR